MRPSPRPHICGAVALCVWRSETNTTLADRRVYISPYPTAHTTPTTTTQDATSSDAANNAAPAPHLQDHWAARPTQQRAFLRRLFQWKADSGGKEVVLLAGAGLAEGCVAAETRLEYSLPPPHPPPPGSKEKEDQHKAGNGGVKANGQDEKDEEEEKPKKAKRRRIGIEQVCVWGCVGGCVYSARGWAAAEDHLRL